MKWVRCTVFCFLLAVVFGGTAAAHVVLDYTQGGEVLTEGTIITIQWHIMIDHQQDNWDLYFSPEGCDPDTWESIQLNLPVSQLTYEWTVPAVYTDQACIQIVMDNTGGDPDYPDVSDTFTIQPTATSVGEPGAYPKGITLYANYPNPFNPSTAIQYELPTVRDVDLRVFNQLGQHVRVLVDERQPAGLHQAYWDGRDDAGERVASGIYLVRLQSGASTQTRSIVLLR